MSANEDIANRHLLAADGLESTLQSEDQYVRIMISERWSSSRAGQLLTACLVNLLCRQVKIVRHVEIVALPTGGLIRLPSGDAAESFPACLRGLAAWAVNGAIAVSTMRTGVAADHTIFVGDPGPELIPDYGQSLVAIGDGWRAWVGDAPRSPGTISATSTNPLGPFLAAALAAGEIFKRSRGLRRGRFLSADGYSLWSGGTSSEWNVLADGPTVSGVCLPPTHVVGAGAVANALGRLSSPISSWAVLISSQSTTINTIRRILIAACLPVGRTSINPKWMRSQGRFAPPALRCFPSMARSGPMSRMRVLVFDSMLRSESTI